MKKARLGNAPFPKGDPYYETHNKKPPHHRNYYYTTFPLVCQVIVATAVNDNDCVLLIAQSAVRLFG